MHNSLQNPISPSASTTSRPQHTTIPTGPSQHQPSNPTNPLPIAAPRHPPPQTDNTACLHTQKELTATTKIPMPQPTTHDHPTQHTTTHMTLQLTTHNRDTSPSTNPDSMQDLAPDPADNLCNQSYLERTTTAWIRQTYAPVFQSIAHLEHLTTRLFDKMSLLLNKQNTDTPRNPTHPCTLTPNQKPLHPLYKPIKSQQQHSILFPLFHCQPPSTTVAISLKPNVA